MSLLSYLYTTSVCVFIFVKNLVLGILQGKKIGSFVALSKTHVLESRELFHKLNVTFMISCQSLYMQAKVCQIETEFQFSIACSIRHTLL